MRQRRPEKNPTRQELAATKIPISSLELGWVAGFMEGEGSFDGGPAKTLGLRTHAVQKQLEPLERLRKYLGGKIYNYGRIYTWTANGYRAAGIMMTLYPLMSPKRQEQIINALDRWKASMNQRSISLQLNHYRGTPSMVTRWRWGEDVNWKKPKSPPVSLEDIGL